MITLLEFGDGAVRDEFVRPTELQIRADRLTESADDRTVLNRHDPFPLCALALQEFRIKRLQVAGEGHLCSRNPGSNLPRFFKLIASGPDGIGEG